MRQSNITFLIEIYGSDCEESMVQIQYTKFELLCLK